MKYPAVVLILLAGTVRLSSTSFAGDPGYSVARVSYVSGDVSYQRGDIEGWNSLRVNTPLVTGDSFYAPDGAKAEVDLGNGIVVRVDGGTQVNLVNNSSGITQLGIDSGTLDLSARSFPQGFSLEIDTPSGAATLYEPGRYRVNVADRVATYSVVRGSMSLAFGGQQLDVRAGESLELENSDPPTYGYGRLSAGTPFQSWANDRDSRFDNSGSARYVHANVVGYEDLDDHGTWRDNREYGRVWVPTGMAQGWAPYQSGRWIWQDPYGWTWVSNESWGWAPYHYGRWVRAGNDWGWVPPPPRGYNGPTVVMNINAVYAPALVAFIGGRNWGLSLSIGGPAIGWVPLAPQERYYYPWQPAPRVTNTYTYTNITVINAVTVVNYSTFATGPVHPVQVDRAQIERAPVIGYTAVGVVPSRGSLLVAPEINPGPRAVPNVRTERPMVTRLVPPPRPEQFTQKVAQIEMTGKPVASPIVREAAVGKPFVPGAKAPAGVSAVSALAPSGRKDLSPRSGAEVRPPKKIERDIAPPPPSTPIAAPTPSAMPAPAAPAPPVTPEATPAPGPGQGKPPQGAPTSKQTPRGKKAPEPAPVPSPVATPQPPTSQQTRGGANKNAPAPQAVPSPGPMEPPPAGKQNQAPPPPVKAVAPAPPATPGATPVPAPATPPPDVPKKNKKTKGKKAPEPPPEPPTEPPPEPPPAPSEEAGT